jgi:hypothetical protein
VSQIGFRKWAWQSAAVRALYQGRPIVLAHRLLSAVGFSGLLGRELVDFKNVRREAKGEINGESERVLFVVPRNFRTHATFQAGVAQALAVRGAHCAFVTCGGIMPVCEVTWAERETFPRCARCSTYVTDLAEKAGLACYRLADYVDSETDRAVARDLEHLTIEQLVRYEWQSIPIGRFAIAPARWRLRSHHVSAHPEGQAVMTGFIRGGALWASGFERVLKAFDPHVVMMLNGLFMEERMSWVIASRQNRRCVFFERGRDAGTVFLSHGESAPRYNVSETWDASLHTSLSESERATVLAAMDRRARGIQMVETYWAVKESDEARIRSMLHLDRDRPMAVLFTNVVWDTAMQDRDTIFSDMLDWLKKTVQFFQTHSEWCLVIRIHPAETQVPGRESYDRVETWLKQEFLELPENIRVVPPDIPIDSYTLIRMARTGCVYASTIGLEMAVAGVSVVVAGAAHYASKGFTYDPVSLEEYYRQLSELMQDRRAFSRASQIERALQYAHVFFLKRMYPMTILDEVHEMRPRLTYQSDRELSRGKRPVLDVICDGILKGASFEFPAQSVTLSTETSQCGKESSSGL